MQFLRTTLQGGAARGARPRAASARWACTRCARGLRAAALVGAAALRRGRVLAAGARRRRSTTSSGCPTASPRRGSDAAHDLDRTLPRGRRAMVLPGQLFAFYDWGGTYRPDPPGADRPARGGALHRALRRPARRRPAVDDRRAGQPAARRCPASCGRCSTCMGVGAVVQGADDDRSRSGAVARLLGGRGPAARSGRPPARYGPPRTRPGRGRARSSRPRALPAGPPLERADRPAWCACCRATAATVVDGSAHGDRRPRRLRRAADRPRAALRRRPRRGRAARAGRRAARRS